MAYFVQLDGENKVIAGIAVRDSDTADDNGVEVEAIGISFCEALRDGTWRRTSYNTRSGEHKLGGVAFRKNYAGHGYTYDEDRDAFIPPQPFPSWLLVEDTCQWNPPVPLPEDAGIEKRYIWNEDEQQWDLIETPSE